MEAESRSDRESPPPLVPADAGSLDWIEWAGLLWSILWRNAVTSVATFLAAILLGAVAGVALGFGASVGGGSAASARGTIKAVSVVVGVSAGLACYYAWVRWILSSRLGSFRLVLVREGEGRGR